MLVDLCEEANNWLEALTLGREPAFTMIGASAVEDEAECNDFIRSEMLNHLDTPGIGIMQAHMYTWNDLTAVFD